MNRLYRKFLKISALSLATTVLFTANPMYASATEVGDRPLAGASKTLDEYYKALAVATTEATLNDNIGIANVDNYLNIRKAAGENQKVIGKLPKDAGCTILDIDKDGWAKIKSGKVTGYVMSSYLITGDKAVSLAKKVGSLVATVKTDALNVRAEASLLSDVITSVGIDEDFDVSDVSADWIQIDIDSDVGYVARQYVDLAYQLKKAVFVEDLDSSSGVSSVRVNMVAYAKQFLGNSYVWGGTSLTNGTDCSGFTQSIYSHFGYSISRVSRSQATNGTTINASNVRPGDLVFYGSGSYINHVSIYIGNGQVIHASNPRSGIKISNMYYRTPIKVVRIIND